MAAPLDEPDLIALSAVTAVPAATLAGMTLARYQGTGLAEVTAEPGLPRTPRWWRQLTGSRYCPRCLAANGGRWMLAWRIPWAFACTGCQVLLADTCPGCGRRHQRTRTGQPRQPGRCDLTGLPLPPWRPPRGATVACTSDPAGTPSAALPAGGHVLAAQQHVDALITALLASRAGQRKQPPCSSSLDDACAVARAASLSPHRGSRRPGRGHRGPGRARRADQDQALPPARSPVRRAGRAGSSRPSPRSASPSPTSCCTAGAAIPTRSSPPGSPANTASRRSTTSPADVLIHWDHASPALQAALARPLAARLDTFYQLRYRAIAGPARIPDPARARDRAAALPSLMWPGWALRLMPPGDHDFLRYRAALAMMLAVAVTGAEDYRTAQQLLGLEPFHSSRLATFTARLRQDGILEPVTAAVCQLARNLDEHGAPVDYARRRRLRRLSQARLDTVAWHRQRYLLSPPRQPARRPGARAVRPAPPDRAAHRHPPPLPARSAATAQDAARTTTNSCSPCPSSWPFACTTKLAHCCPRPASASLSPGNPRSTGPPASPGPDRTRTASGPKTCTRLSGPACPSGPSPPGSAPPPTTSGSQQPATRRPSSRREPRTALARAGTARQRPAPRPHQPGIRRAQDRPHHRVQRAHHQTAPRQRRAPPPGPA